MVSYITNKGLIEDNYSKSPSQTYRDRRAGLFPRAVRFGNANLTVKEEYETFKLALKDRRDHPKLAAKITAWQKSETKAGRNPYDPDRYAAFIHANGLMRT